MASWVLAQVPWMSVRRARRPLEVLATTIRHSKNHINASIQLSPAAEALKKLPYPSRMLDLSVFEERSEEYDVIRENLSTTNAPMSSIQTLTHLVEQENYQSAERVLADLRHLHVEIPLDARYEKAAIAVLEQPQGQTRETAFANWFSLIPMAHDSVPRSFHTISQKLLYTSSSTDLSLILRFGLICASKGYAQKVFRQVVPFVVRFSDPIVSASWMDQFEKLAVDYTRRFHPAKVRKMLKSYRSLTISTHCLAGRTEEALRIFQATMKDKLSVSRFTASLLLRSLQKINGTTNTEQIIDLYKLSPDLFLKCNISADVSQTSFALPPITSSQTARLAVQLRSLKRSITSHRPPTIRTMVGFILRYLSTGRKRALVMLRKKAFQHSQRSASYWIMTEMAYYLDQMHNDMVILTFATHFHLIGVPQDLIFKQLANSELTMQATQGKFRSHLIPYQYPMTQKLPPSSRHTTLLWKALLHLSKSQEDLQRLYQQLLHYARCNRHSAEPLSSPSELQSLTAIPPPGQVIDEVHFNPFISAFRKRFGPYRALEILQDMQDLGMHPNYYQYATLAEGFAKIGDPHMTITLLDEVERCSRARNADLYPNMVVMYTDILRWLTKANCLDAVADVEDRLFKNTGYAAGSNQIRSLLRRHLRKGPIPDGV